MSPRTGIGLTVAALVTGAGATTWAVADPRSPVVAALTGLVVPGLLAVAGAQALQRRGALVARSAWSTGFDDADAGRQEGPLASAWLPLVLAAWALGVAAIAPVLAPLFRDVRSRAARNVLAAWVAAVIAVALGIALSLPLFAALASIGVLFLLTWRRDARPPPADLPGTPWPRRVLATLAATTLVAGVASLAIAFSGSSWPGFPGDGTRAMQVGLALAGLGALPLVVAGGAVLRSFPRHRRSIAPVFAAAAVAAGAGSQTAGSGGAAQESLLYAGALLAGVAGALLVLPLLPPFGAWQPVVAAALSAGLAAAAGLPVVVGGPVLAPVIAAAALVLLRRLGAAPRATAGRVEPSA